MGRGGGGVVPVGRERRVRWRVCRAVRWGVREGEGEERALVVGSRVRGRRVKVSSGGRSMVEMGWSGSWIAGGLGQVVVNIEVLAADWSISPRVLPSVP